MEEFLFLKEDNYLSPNMYSPLVLAYIGDSVFDLLVRTHLISKSNEQVSKINEKAKKYVKASSQAKMYIEIEKYLTEAEHEVLKRGRNAKSHTSAKNATIGDYRHATGFEALLGYLYLSGEFKRIMELFNMCIEVGEKIEK